MNARRTTPLRIIYKITEYICSLMKYLKLLIYITVIFIQPLNDNSATSKWQYSIIDSVRCVNSKCISSLLFCPVPESECIFIIHNFQNTMKKHKDKIPVHLIKENAAIPSLLLCNIINKCFITGIFPDSYKQATVVSFHPQSFRFLKLLIHYPLPISVLFHFYHRLVN